MTEPWEGADNLQTPPPRVQKVEFECLVREDGTECAVIPMSLFHRMFHISAWAVQCLRAARIPEEQWPGDLLQFVAEWDEEANVQAARAKRKKS